MTNLAQPDWKESIVLKLQQNFDTESFIRIILYLNNKDNEHNKRLLYEVPPDWKTLKFLLHNEIGFNMYALKICEETKKKENDEKLQLEIYNYCKAAIDEPFEIISETKFNNNLEIFSGFMGFGFAFKYLSPNVQGIILKTLPKLITNRNLLISLDDIVKVTGKSIGNYFAVALAVLYIGIELKNGLKLIKEKKITPKRFTKNFVNSIFSVGGGLGGGYLGSCIGLIFGPVGAIIGGVIGGVVTSCATEYFINLFTEKWFDLPMSVAVENAYYYLNVSPNASDQEISSAFKKLCLKLHPDKGGNSQDFYTLQMHMLIIKESRSNKQNNNQSFKENLLTN